MDAFALTYEGFDPDQEGLREATLKLRGEAASAVGRKRGKAKGCGHAGTTTEVESERTAKSREAGR